MEADEQQVDLTRFSLFFPEKRGILSREPRAVSIRWGTRLRRSAVSFLQSTYRPRAWTAKSRFGAADASPVESGAFDVGVINIQTGDDPRAGSQATNFSVVRVRRDILRRSSIGALFTRRSVSLNGVGSNETYGLDGRFSFFEHLIFDTYLARTQTGGLTGDDTSYRAQLTYEGDRYGLIAHRLVVGKHFNPEVGFLFRNDIAKYFTRLRFSPRPASIKSVRKLSWLGQIGLFRERCGAASDARNPGGVYRRVRERRYVQPRLP